VYKKYILLNLAIGDHLVTIKCEYCGTDLPREDARFCTHCGMLVPSHPLSPQSLAAAKGNAQASAPLSPAKQEDNKSVLREQVAYLPPARPPRRVPDTPAIRPSRRKPAEQSAWPTPVTHVSVKESSPTEKDAAQSEQQDVVATPASRQPSVVEVEKAGEEATHEDGQEELPDKETRSSEDLPTRPMPPISTDRSESEEQAIETLPTSPLEDSLPELSHDRSVADMPTSQISLSSPEQWHRRSVPATPVVSDDAQREMEPHQSVTVSAQQEQERSIVDVAVDANIENDRSVIAQQLTTPVPLTAAPLTPLPTDEERVDGSMRNWENGTLFAIKDRLRGRLPLLVGVILLLILIIGGTGIWISAYQPFSVAPITQPEVGFRDTHIGVSLLYPNGWTKQVESGKSSVQFYASNHIAEVDIMAVDSGGDVNQALQQQSIRLGMGGTKAGAALTFGGAMWRQLQGNVQESGANYTAIVLATVHGKRLFTIVQLAPQSNYADWEKEFFAPLRTSLHFL
jgi:hypothetical protein